MNTRFASARRYVDASARTCTNDGRLHDGYEMRLAGAALQKMARPAACQVYW